MYNKTTNKNINEYRVIRDIKNKVNITIEEMLFLEMRIYIEVASKCALMYRKDESNFSIYNSKNNEYEETVKANKKIIKEFVAKCEKLAKAFEKEYEEKIKNNETIEDYKIIFMSDFNNLYYNSYVSNLKEDIFKNEFLKKYETETKKYIKDFKIEDIGIRGDK